VDAPVTAEMVAELRGGGKDFGSKVRGRRRNIEHPTSNTEQHRARPQDDGTM